MNRLFWFVLKLLLVLGIFTALFSSVSRDDYQTFVSQPKRWDRLVLAQCLIVCAIGLTALRWRRMLQALDIAYGWREILVLGFLAYMLNFLTLGSGGGDVFKAAIVCKSRPDRRVEAIASVAADRYVGLLTLFLLATSCLWILPNTILHSLMLPTVLTSLRLWITLISAMGVLPIVIALCFGSPSDHVGEGTKPIGRFRRVLARLLASLRLLRSRSTVMFEIGFMALLAHMLVCLSVFLISQGIYSESPNLAEHFLVVPTGLAAGALGGLGFQEAALSGLFRTLPDLPAAYSGVMVATVYRCITVLASALGLIGYVRLSATNGDTSVHR